LIQEALRHRSKVVDGLFSTACSGKTPPSTLPTASVMTGVCHKTGLVTAAQRNANMPPVIG
jgi:hypothetical protein